MGGILYWLIPPQCTRILGSTAGPAVRGVVKQILKRVQGLDMSFISASQKHNVLHWSPIHLTLIIFVRIILNNYCTQSPWTYFGGRAELKKVLRRSRSKSWWSFRSWVFWSKRFTLFFFIRTLCFWWGSNFLKLSPFKPYFFLFFFLILCVLRLNFLKFFLKFFQIRALNFLKTYTKKWALIF